MAHGQDCRWEVYLCAQASIDTRGLCRSLPAQAERAAEEPRLLSGLHYLELQSTAFGVNQEYICVHSFAVLEVQVDRTHPPKQTRSRKWALYGPLPSLQQPLSDSMLVRPSVVEVVRASTLHSGQLAFEAVDCPWTVEEGEKGMGPEGRKEWPGCSSRLLTGILFTLLGLRNPIVLQLSPKGIYFIQGSPNSLVMMRTVGFWEKGMGPDGCDAGCGLVKKRRKAWDLRARSMGPDALDAGQRRGGRKASALKGDRQGS